MLIRRRKIYKYVPPLSRHIAAAPRYLVMSRKPEAFPAAHGGTPYDVRNGAVVLYEVHVDRGKVFHLIAEIPRKGNCL